MNRSARKASVTTTKQSARQIAVFGLGQVQYGLPLAGVDEVLRIVALTPALNTPDWVAGIRDQCVDANVAFFFKQWGGRTPKTNGRNLDGVVWDEMPEMGRIDESR